MAVLKKLLMLSFLLALIFIQAIADESIQQEIATEEVAIGSNDGSDSFSILKIELEQLKSTIIDLESSVNEKTQQLKSKDEIINQKEDIILEKSERISYLQSDISSLREKGSVDFEEQLRKAHARADELEKPLTKLKKKFELQQKEKDDLEAKLSDAEKKILELNSKLENLQMINDDQKVQIKKTERALQLAEKEMIKAKFELTSTNKNLVEVHGAWLPPWLAAHLIRVQSFVEMHWNESGKPAMEITIKKVLEKKAQAEKWAEPHLENIQTTWIPAINEQWIVITTYVEPHYQSITSKSIEVYEVSKTTISPHIIKVREFVNPHFEEVRKFSKPYINQIATVTKPHIEKARIAAKPYTKKVMLAYEEFLEFATSYYHQIQDMRKNYELTNPFAATMVQFMVPFLWAYLIINMLKFSLAVFCKKENKPSRHAQTHHARRKAKHGHSHK